MADAIYSGQSFSGFHVSDQARVHAGNVYNVEINTDILDASGKLLLWLAAPDHTSDQSDARRKRESDTGEWLLREPAFERWLSGRTRLLWVHGKAGCCKTTLCSLVVDTITERLEYEPQDQPPDQPADQPRSSLLYFYFSFADTTKQKYKSLLLSLLSQLVQLGLDEQSILELTEMCRRNRRHVTELEEVLRRLLNRLGHAFIVIDGLDESPEEADGREEVLEGLESMYSECADVQLLIFSRREVDIEECMESMSARRIAVQDHPVDEDIKTYLSRELERNRKLRSLDSEIKVKIQSTLAKNSGGMFRWAYCQLQNIKGLKIWTKELIHQTLHEMPRTLDETYSRILLGIDEKYQVQARLVLQWLSLSSKPLSFSQIADICVTNVDRRPFVQEVDRKPMEGIIVVLSALVQVSYGIAASEPSADPVVSLAHASVKDYLCSSRIRSSPTSFFAIEISDTHVNEPQIDWFDRFPLLNEAVARWSKYQSQAEYAINSPWKPGLELALLSNYEARLRRNVQKVQLVSGRAAHQQLYTACVLDLPRTVALLCGFELEGAQVDDLSATLKYVSLYEKPGSI
ncbi:hypothetical protein MBLNU13_g09513t1 [Cladosporium sp. NU13]